MRHSLAPMCKGGSACAGSVICKKHQTACSYCRPFVIPRSMARQEDKPLDKPKLTEENLKECGISYHAEVLYKVEKKGRNYLPEHVDIVRNILLESRETIHPRYKDRFIRSGGPQPDTSMWLDKTDENAISESEKIRETVALSATANSILVADKFKGRINSAESGWTQDLLNSIFKPFDRTEVINEYALLPRRTPTYNRFLLMRHRSDLFQEWRL